MRRRAIRILLGLLLAAGGLSAVLAPPAQADDPVLVGAGDIGDCSTQGDELTASLLDGIPGTVFTTGDHAYPNGSASDFANCYEPSWGRHKARTKPASGNHDFQTPGAAGYFGYFGAAAGTAPGGYYSYDLGAWHIVMLNSECPVLPGGCGAESPQVQWLRADLAATDAECVAAVMHRHRFASGARHGSDTAYIPFWDALQDYGADVILNGHSHFYERFGLQDSAGRADPAGIRQFTVGTGGRGRDTFGTALPNSQFRYRDDWGVLKLDLRAGSYDWQFIRATGAAVVDSGSQGCHGRTQPPIDTFITSGPSGTTPETGASFGFTANRADPAFECQLDGATPAPCASPASYAGLAEGTHTFSVRAVSEGETDPSPATRSWTVGLAPPGPVTLGAEADTRVVQASPGSNFGGQAVLEADTSPVVESLLRFSVTGVSGTVSRARLRLWVTDASGNGPAVYLTSGAAWSESAVTWNTKPPRSGAAVANVGSVSAGRYLDYVVTGAVPGNGTYTFNLVADSTDGTDFSSREASANRPQLVIETGTVAPPPPPPPPPPAGSVTLLPTADTRVVQGSPGSNFGGQAALEADSSPVVESLLRFNVTGLSGTVTRARLRLYVTDASGNGPAVYRTNGATWTESGVTWNTKPARSGAAVANVGSVSSGRYLDYVVTSAVPGNGTFTFNLVADSTDGTDFNSREAASNRPQLVIETA